MHIFLLPFHFIFPSVSSNVGLLSSQIAVSGRYGTTSSCPTWQKSLLDLSQWPWAGSQDALLSTSGSYNWHARADLLHENGLSSLDTGNNLNEFPCYNLWSFPLNWDNTYSWTIFKENYIGRVIFKLLRLEQTYSYFLFFTILIIRSMKEILLITNRSILSNIMRPLCNNKVFFFIDLLIPKFLINFTYWVCPLISTNEIFIPPTTTWIFLSHAYPFLCFSK